MSIPSEMPEALKDKKVALVADWITDRGGAELVFSQLMQIFADADIFTSVFYQSDNSLFENYEVVPYGKKGTDSQKPKIYTSFVQKIPYINKKHKLSLFFRPQAFESFDLSGYDIVIASTSAESKGLITKPDTLFISYCHTPTRYFWSHYEQYKNMMEFGLLNPLAKLIFPVLIERLRKWDYIAAQRPDYFIANSQNTAERIAKYYHRKSEVIYPSITTQEFPLQEEKGDYYLAVGRCIPYKKFDLIVDTFNANGKQIIIATNTDNALYRELVKKSGPNITWKLNLPREEIIELYAHAKGFIFPPEEDFGLVPIEAAATGTPTIAYKKGGALETVVDGKTGIFFNEQTPESLQEALDRFETLSFDAKIIRKHAEQFDTKNFQEQIVKCIEEKMKTNSNTLENL